MISRRDWTLLVLSAAGGSPLSPVQLQKALFLVGKTIPWAVGDNFYEFIPYNYGPFDPTVYSDAESLSADDLTVISHQPGRKWDEYGISAIGQAEAERIKGELGPQVALHVKSIVKWIQSVTFEQLLKAIYDKFPEYATNSVFRR